MVVTPLGRIGNLDPGVEYGQAHRRFRPACAFDGPASFVAAITVTRRALREENDGE
ncbi:hypothetical protein ACQKJZ_12490 [Sphingomonas sp. NPDC019816]|uniref:hypothetical protein n=1 Tax=Sphingomonas sp. NPDC019816 TaxID=3390679 RepID=UPI003D0501B2